MAGGNVARGGFVLVDGHHIGVDRQPTTVRHGVARVHSEVDECRGQLIRIDQHRSDVTPLDAIDLDLPAESGNQQITARSDQRLDIRASGP